MKMWTYLYFVCCVAIAVAKPSRQASVEDVPAGDNLFVDGDQGQIDWNSMAQTIIDNHEADPQLEIQTSKQAKNVILFIGDGMGVSTISAARIYSMQKDEKTLSFDSMPVNGMSRTYNTDAQVPDSAATATAFLCGVKNRRRALGVTQDVQANNCNQTWDNRVDSVLKKAVRSGKWTGIVTTTRLTHATPGAAFAHAADRDYESDLERDDTVNEFADVSKCPDIASQLIDDVDNQKIRVLLGGGRRAFYPNTEPDPEETSTTGFRKDNRNLTQIWVDQKVSAGTSRDRVQYVWKLDDFDRVNPDNTDYLMGLFEKSHMNFELDREDDIAGEPSLPMMVEKAILMLKRSPDGFFLLVEGGRVDHAHHETKFAKAMEETLQLSEAVRVAQALTDADDSLIVVTADHSHALTFNGYPYINNNILGLARAESGDLLPMQDGKPFTTLSYTNGPGFLDHRTYNLTADNLPDFITDDDIIPRIDLTEVEGIGTKDFFYDTGMYVELETHAGEDVAVYASGPMSRMFTGTYEQHYIAHGMMYASCVGDYSDRTGCSSASASLVSVMTMFITTVIALATAR